MGVVKEVRRKRRERGKGRRKGERGRDGNRRKGGERLSRKQKEWRIETKGINN